MTTAQQKQQTIWYQASSAAVVCGHLQLLLHCPQKRMFAIRNHLNAYHYNTFKIGLCKIQSKYLIRTQFSIVSLTNVVSHDNDKLF